MYQGAPMLRHHVLARVLIPSSESSHFFLHLAVALRIAVIRLCIRLSPPTSDKEYIAL